MSIENFHTSIVQNGQQQGSGKALGTSKSTGTLGSLNFFDAFLQNLQQAQQDLSDNSHSSTNKFDTKKVQTVQNQILQSDNPVLAKDPSINLVQILATNKDVTEELSKLDNAQLGDVLGLNAQEFDEQLIQIKNALAAGNPKEISIEISKALGLQNKTSIHPFDGDLKAYLKQLDTQIKEDGPELTALNITPEQITRLQKDIADLSVQISTGKPEEKLNEEFTAIFAAIINIAEPQKQQFSDNQRQVFVLTTQPNTQNNAQTPADNLQNLPLPARLNALIPGGDGGDISLPQDGESWLDSLDDFENLVKDAIKNLKGGKDGQASHIGAPTNQNGQSPAQQTAQNLSALQNWPFGNSGSLFAPQDLSAALDEMGLINAQSQPGSLGSLTALVTQSQSAGTPHPGTSIVAAAITKSAANGEAKTMTLQMDPPELGRVEVKMKFSADKTVKAIVTAEKPETYLMLQRDAHTLERALSDAGIDAENSSLSFELADEGFDFGHNGGHDGSEGGQHGKAPEGDEETEILQTTMDWHVDPETGHMRYNILV